MIYSINQPSDLYKINDPSFSLNNLDSNPDHIHLYFYRAFNQDKIPWGDLIRTYSSITLSIDDTAYVGNITELLMLSHIKHLSIYSSNFSWTMDIIRTHVSINININKICSEEEIYFLRDFCVCNPQTELSLWYDESVEHVFFALETLTIVDSCAPDLRSFRIRNLEVKNPMINWYWLPPTIKRLKLHVIPNSLNDCLNFLGRCPYIIIEKSVNLPIWALSDILQMPDLVYVICHTEIQLNNEDERQLIDAISNTRATCLLLFGLKLQNPQYLRILQSKLVTNHTLESLCMETKSPIIEEICDRNRRNHQKLRSLRRLAYSCAKSHNLEIPSYIVSQLDSK
jgi:hypothetical protein